MHAFGTRDVVMGSEWGRRIWDPAAWGVARHALHHRGLFGSRETVSILVVVVVAAVIGIVCGPLRMGILERCREGPKKVLSFGI